MELESSVSWKSKCTLSRLSVISPKFFGKGGLCSFLPSSHGSQALRFRCVMRQTGPGILKKQSHDRRMYRNCTRFLLGNENMSSQLKKVTQCLIIRRYRAIVFPFLTDHRESKASLHFVDEFVWPARSSYILSVMIIPVFSPREAITGFSQGYLYSARSR